MDSASLLKEATTETNNQIQLMLIGEGDYKHLQDKQTVKKNIDMETFVKKIRKNFEDIKDRGLVSLDD
jgi:uncharacterized protein YjaZ